MQDNGFVKNESYSRVTTSTAISSDLSLSLSEEQKIVCLNGRVVTLSKQSLGGRAVVKSRIIFNLIYSTDEGLQCYESGADLELNFLADGLTEGYPLLVEYEVGSLRAERGQAGVTVSAVVTAEALYHLTQSENFLQKIDGAVCKSQQVECFEYAGCNLKRFEESGEKILSTNLNRVLYSEPQAIIKEVQCGIGEIIVDGEILSELVVCLDGGKVQQESLTTPFRYEIECDFATPECVSVASVEVLDANYKILREEDSEKSIIRANYLLEICGEVYKREQKECLLDAFFGDRELELRAEEFNFCESVAERVFTKKCFGEGVCTRGEKHSLVGLVCSQINGLNYSHEGEKTTLTCALKCTAITKDEQNAHSSCEVELPVNLVLDTNNPPLQLIVSKKGVSLSENEGKIFVEGELIIQVVTAQTSTTRVVVWAEAGDLKVVDDSAIGVIFIRAGEDSWSVCKKAGVSESTLREQNPNLDFPAERDCAVVVFRPTT